MEKVEKQAHIAHIVMGYSGAALFVTLICLLLFFAPKISSFLKTGQEAAQNLNVASNVWAGASKNEAKQVNNIATDIRTSVVKFNREVIPAISGTLSATTQAVNTANTQIASIGGNVQDTDLHVNKLLDSIKQTSDSAHNDLQTLNTALVGIGPLVYHADESVNSLNKLLASKDLNQAINGIATTSQNVGKISGDIYSFEHPHLNPEPCKTKGCKFKRNVWPWVKGTLMVGSEAEEVSRWFRPIPVTIKK